MFLGLQDPDPSSSKKSMKNLDLYCFLTSSDFLSLKTDVTVTVTVKVKSKNTDIMKAADEKSRILIQDWIRIPDSVV